MPRNNFKNQDLRRDLRSRSVQGSFFTLIGQVAIFVVQIGGTAVLARLLTPGDFGLIAMVTALTGLPAMLRDAGLSMATVQKESITHEQVSTLFWINAGISLLLALMVCAGAPLVALFYSEPRLLEITLAVSASVFLGGLAVQQQALIKRRMKYGTLSLILVSTQISATSVGIIAALAGAGYWALVAMYITQPFILFILNWICSGWRPGRPRRGTGVGEMVRFGGNLTISRFFNYLVRRLDNILIGYFTGVAALGLYSKAYSLLMLPINQINQPMANVVIPSLSRLQSDEVAYRKYYKKALFYMTSLVMPVVMFCFIFTEDIILVVLGEQWVGAIPIFKALVPAAFVGTFNYASSWALVPLGQAHKEMKLSVFNGFVIILAFFIGVQWGALGVAVSLSLGEVLKRPFTLWYAFKESPIKFSDFNKSIALPFMASLGATAAIIGLMQAMPALSIYKNLFIYGVLFIIIYLGIWLWRPGAFKEVKCLLMDLKHRSLRF